VGGDGDFDADDDDDDDFGSCGHACVWLGTLDEKALKLTSHQMQSRTRRAKRRLTYAEMIWLCLSQKYTPNLSQSTAAEHIFKHNRT